mgnify:FL=1
MGENTKDIVVRYAVEEHVKYAETICQLIYDSSLQCGSGLARRRPEYIAGKISGGKAVVALDGDSIVGFCYIECWSNGEFVANSALIVHPEYRNLGIAKRIMDKIFQLSRERFPYAKLFYVTSNLAVMKHATRLGFVPTTFSELAQDDDFWVGCEGCEHFEILKNNNRQRCLCIGMIYDPKNGIFYDLYPPGLQH